MSDDQRSGSGENASGEEALEERLRRLGPFMAQQARAEDDLDMAFAATLRAQLLGMEAPTPDPTFARALRDRLVAGPLPARRMLGHAPLARVKRWTVAVVLLLAAATGALVNQSRPARGPVFADLVPVPSVHDLLLGFPGEPAPPGPITPLQSLVHPAYGRPYGGRLEVVLRALPALPAQTTAYRLQAPADVRRFASILDIHARLRRVRADGATWSVAAVGGGSTGRRLHSIALSLETGQIVYHDRRNSHLRHSEGPPSRRHAVADARRWLMRLGWPGYRMPLQSVSAAPGLPHTRQIVLGWREAGSMPVVPAATLWVVPDGSIVEAWLWPPVARAGRVPLRGVQAGLAALLSGAAPVAIPHLPPTEEAPGVATIERTGVALVLSRGPDGRMYLVPVFRLRGKVSLRGGAGMRRWYALTPAQRK